MPAALTALGPLLAGTLTLRPYVFAFLAAFAVAAARDLGTGRMLGFLVWGFLVAFTAELASTRIGIPFGMYHYTEATRGTELFLSNVPFFDSLSFPFLAYASLCLARRVLRGAGRGALTLLAGVLMMLLDVVIDPIAVRGDRWFLGRIFFYPDGGVYFGVPLSNFGGWLIVGWVIAGGYLAVARDDARGAGPGLGVGLYYGVLLFNLAITAWIGEFGLLAVGILIHMGTILLLYALGGAGKPSRAAPGGKRRS